jgi:hypothetical protein
MSDHDTIQHNAQFLLDYIDDRLAEQRAQFVDLLRDVAAQVNDADRRLLDAVNEALLRLGERVETVALERSGPLQLAVVPAARTRHVEYDDSGRIVRMVEE